MKRYTYYILVALLAFVGQTVQAQTAQDALYIYRNDGGFNAFFFADIDHFEYSNIDTLGVAHDDMVVQEIYALDTLYRIPISAIDSIAFVTPKTIYKKDVAHTSKSDLWKYVVKGDSTQFTLAANTPQSLIPKVGDKLVKEDYTSNMPFGVYGKVSSVNTQSDGTIVNFEPVALTDLFDQYVCKGGVELGEEGDSGQARTRGGKYIGNGSFTYDEDFDLPSYTMNENLLGLSSLLTAKYKDVTCLVSGTGNVVIKISPKVSIRGFYSLGIAGEHYVVTVRGETSATTTFTGKGSLTLRFDKGIPLIEKKIWIPKTPLIAVFEVGLTANMSISGGYEVDVFSKKSYYGSSQFFSSILNKGFPYYVIPPDVNITMSTHHLDYQENIFFTGQTSIQLGVYASASIADLANMLAKATLRAEMGPKVTCSVTIPDGIFESELPETIGETSTNTYSMLSKFGSYIPSVTLGGKFVLTSPIASGFSSGWVKDLGSWNIYEHKGSILPDVVYTKATYDLDSEILKAEASLGQYTPGSIYPGFALYKDNHLTTAAYMSTPYDSGALDSNALVLFRELKDGVYDVYPAFKTRGFNFLGTPMAKTVVGKPELKVSPEKLSFTPDGGTQTVTVTRKIYDKLDVIKQGIGYEEWWSYKKDKDDQYIITVKPTDEGRERDSYIEFEASVEGSNPLVKETVKVTFTQKGTTILTVAPQKLELLGYNSESFKYGEHTTSISATCRKEGEVVLVTSSDKNWLRVYEWEGEATTSGDYTTRKRKIAVSPNTSFVNPRTGTITVTAYYAHEYFEEQIEVLQKPMTPTMELSEETVTLLSSEKEGAAYSNSVHVFVESNLFDEALTRYVEKRGVTTSDPNWLEATVDNRTITIRAKTNTTESDRTGTVTYTVTMKNGETKSGIIKVKQLKNVVNVPFTTNPKEIRFSVKGGDKTVRIVGDNIKGITDIDCMSLSWLGGVASGTTVTLSAKESKLPEERIGTVYLTLEMNDGSIVKHYFLVYQDGTETVPEEAPAGFPTAEVLKSLINGGMPIYYGDTPPTVDGVFSQSPVTDVASTVVYDVDDDTEIGEDPPIRCVVKFSNQTAGNTIYWNAYSVFMEEDEEDPDAAYSSDINSSIMGSGDKFCVAAHLNSTYNNFYMELFGFPKGQYGYLCSGEVDGDVIRNLYVAFTSWTQPDFYTIDKDGDGVSYHTGWAPWVPEDDEEADVRGMTRQQGNTLPADLLKKLPIKHLLEKLLKAQKNRIQP